MCIAYDDGVSLFSILANAQTKFETSSDRTSEALLKKFKEVGNQ